MLISACTCQAAVAQWHIQPHMTVQTGVRTPTTTKAFITEKISFCSENLSETLQEGVWRTNFFVGTWSTNNKCIHANTNRYVQIHAHILHIHAYTYNTYRYRPYACIYTLIHAYTCIFIHIHTRPVAWNKMHQAICACIHLYVHECVCIAMIYTYTHSYIQIHTYADTYVHIQVHIVADTNKYIYIQYRHIHTNMYRYIHICI
jgi:hypothetical protein